MISYTGCKLPCQCMHSPLLWCAKTRFLYCTKFLCGTKKGGMSHVTECSRSLMIIVIRCLDVSKYHQPHPLVMSSSPAAIIREWHRMSAVITGLEQCFARKMLLVSITEMRSAKIVYFLFRCLWVDGGNWWYWYIKFMRRLVTCMGNWFLISRLISTDSHPCSL